MSNRPHSDRPAPASVPPGVNVWDRAAGGAPVPVYRTEELFSGGVEIRLDHGGSEYRLKITRQGKLILNK